MQYWRESVIEDAYSLAPRLREADKQEIRAAVGMTPLAGLLYCLETSNPALTIIKDGEPPLGVFGLTPDPDNFAASVWMLAANEITKYPMTFMKNAIKWVQKTNTEYPVLYNYVDARNTLHIKWLRWMGFTFLNAKRMGPENRLFFEFVRIEPCV